MPALTGADERTPFYQVSQITGCRGWGCSGDRAVIARAQTALEPFRAFSEHAKQCLLLAFIDLTAQPIPFTPRHGALPYTVGNGNDYFANVGSNLLSSVTGSFRVVSGLTSISNYSLQLNTDHFSTSACNNSSDPSCRGWVQFIYSKSPSEVLIESWLIDWGSSTCPSGWTSYNNGGELDCYINSPTTSSSVPLIADWPYIDLEGQTTSSTNEVTFYSGEGSASAESSDSVLDLSQGWNEAEFNVFGNCCSEQANLNSDTSFVVQMSLDDGTTTAPTPGSGGFTGETNSLSLVGSACPVAGSSYESPYLQFMESNDPSATETCGTGGADGNFVPTPYSSGTYTTNGGAPPTITFTETLSDSNPNADIYWTVPGCAGSVSGSDPLSAGGSFTLVYQSGSDCNPSGTMYATASGELQSPVTSIDFP